MLHFENNFNARFYVWSVYSKKINLKLWTLVYSVNSPSPKPSSFPVLLKRFVSSPRIFSNQAFNRTTILHLLGCSSVLKNSENGQYVHLGPLLMYKKRNLQFRQKWAQNWKICDFFTQSMSLGDGIAAVFPFFLILSLVWASSGCVCVA